MRNIFLLLFTLLGLNSLFAQTTISGQVIDDAKEPLIGANVVLKGTTTGTVTDIDGKFKLTLDEKPPFTLVISYVGYNNKELIVDGTQSNLQVVLNTENSILDEVVVSASRVEEKLLESPVSIEKLDLQTIKASTSSDYYDQMLKLKGVTGATGSMTFNAINTRGFGGIANTRFVQLVDGIDNAAPLLNFPMGNLIGIGENDVQSIELVPGAASALYGPNAFNGIMIMSSKSPFDYEGLTISFKQGFSKADNDKANPLTNGDFRYGKTWGKFGLKVTGSYFQGTDWKSDDYYTDVVTKEHYDGNVANRPLNFNGVNTYGDEGVLSTVPFFALPTTSGTGAALVAGVGNALAGPAFGGDTAMARGFVSSNMKYLPTVQLRRTGIKEEDLLDSRKASSVKTSLGLYYKPTDDININYTFRFGNGNTIYQGSEKYALRNFWSMNNKIEATGKNFMVRSYMTQTNAGQSYNMTALGSYANELMAGTAAAWAPTYLGTYVGGYMQQALQYIAGGGDPTTLPTFFQSPQLFDAISRASRASADALQPARGSDAYRNAIKTIKGTLFQHADPSAGILGGASFIDHSRMFHTEATYDFTSMVDDKLGILVGANHRLYSIFTEGTVLNEDPNGTGKDSRIKINEYGAFVQLTKKMIQERLRISASIRYDKNENFKGVWSPRVAAVASLGDKRQHNIRASFQTGFRNPDTQAQFIYFPASTILMGGAKKNAARYGVYEGGAYTADSYNAYMASVMAGAPDSSKLKTYYMNYISPEKLTAVEVGYKAVIKNLYVDWNAYFNWYRDFITQSNVVAKKSFIQQGQNVAGAETGSPKVLRPYHNLDNKVTSWGSAIALTYRLPKGLQLNGNYNYMDFDGHGQDRNSLDFNSPSHVFNIGLSGNNIGNSSFGFDLSYRWQSEFYWVSSFGFGNIDAYGTFDASLAYNIKSANTTIRMGATNMAGPNYNTNIGGPMIGRTFFVGLTYDGSVLGGKKNK